MGTVAAIFVQRGAHKGKQLEMCFAYLREQHWRMWSIVQPWAPEDAGAMARAGEISMVVTAFDSRAASAMAADVQGHARVVVLRPEPHELEPPEEPPRRGLPSLVELILRWHRKGKSIPEIAADIDGETTDVRAILRRAGKHPHRTD